jgi:hypothetical protein
MKERFGTINRDAGRIEAFIAADVPMPKKLEFKLDAALLQVMRGRMRGRVRGRVRGRTRGQRRATPHNVIVNVWRAEYVH